MFTLKPLSKSLIICSTIALSQLSAVQAMEAESEVLRKVSPRPMTFSPEDVLNHLAKCGLEDPKFFEDYDMDHLTSKAGKNEIQNYIHAYNTGETTKYNPDEKTNNFILEGINEGSPNDEYNMARVAYAITLDRYKKAQFKFPYLN